MGRSRCYLPIRAFAGLDSRPRPPRLECEGGGGQMAARNAVLVVGLVWVQVLAGCASPAVPTIRGPCPVLLVEVGVPQASAR